MQNSWRSYGYFFLNELTKILWHVLDFNLGVWSYESLSKQKIEVKEIIRKQI